MFIVVGFLIGIFLFVGLVYHTGLHEILSSVQVFGIGSFLFFIGVSLINFCLYTWRWQIIVRGIYPVKRIPFFHLFNHRMSGFAAGYITPAAQVAGEPVRVALLHAEGVPIKEATGSVVLDLAFEIAAFLLYIMAGVVLALLTNVGTEGIRTLAVTCIIVLLSFVITFFVSVAKGWNIFHRILRWKFFFRHHKAQEAAQWLLEVEELMTKFFAGHGFVLAGIVVLSCVMTGFRALEAFLLTYFFQSPTTITGAFLLSTLPGLVLFLPVPGGIGLFEASNAAMLTTLGVNVNPIAYTMIIRLRDFVFILWGMLHGFFSGATWLGRKK